MDKRLTTLSNALGTTLILTVIVTLVATWILFACHIPANAFVFPISVLISLIITRLLYRNDISPTWLAVYSILIIIISCVLCSFLWDNSYDGNTYHQATLLYLADGWNPIYETCPAENIWSHHYAKALEVISAQILVFINSTRLCSPLAAIEASKAVNLLLFLSTILFITSFLWKRFPQISHKNKIGITILIASNPVVLTQLFTFYNDFAIYCLSALLLTSFFGISTHDKASAFVAISATLLAITTKFTHFFFIGIEWLAFFVYMAFKRQWKPFRHWFAYAAIVTFLGVVITGFNPYVTNTVNNGHPFYPLMGSDTDIMTKNTPSIYNNGNRFSNFIKSQFTDPDYPEWSAFPLPKSKASLMGVGYDSRSMGFGPLFAWILILTMIMLIFGRQNKTAWYIAGCTLTVSFIFPQAWWARYVAFLWLLPLSVCVFTTIYSTSVFANRLKAIVYALALIGGAVPLTVQLVKNVATRDYEIQLFKAMNASQPVKVDLAGFESFAGKMNRMGISFMEISAEDIDKRHAVYMYGKNDGNTYPIVELTEPAYSSLISDCRDSRLIQIERRQPSQPTK